MKKQAVSIDAFSVFVSLFSMILLLASMKFPSLRYGVILIWIIYGIYSWKYADRLVELPKSHTKVNTYRQVMILSIIMICIFYSVSYIHSKENQPAYPDYAVEIQDVVLLLFMMVCGNLSPRIPFNRTLGLRLPWTVSDEATWRYAHRMIGYATIPACLMMLLGFGSSCKDIAFIIGVGIWVLVPSVLSLCFYLKQKGTL